MRVDIIIIGAGLGGSVTASALSKAGYKVALIDARRDYPSEFRAEKMGHEQIALFERLGLADVAMAHTTQQDHVLVARFGRIIAHGQHKEYGFHYSDLVNGLRRAIPAGVDQIIGRVTDIETSEDLQHVTLSDGSTIEGQLLILATGLGDSMRKKVGIERTVISSAHSLSFGFTFEASPARFPFDSLVYYGSGAQNRIAYMSIFQIENEMRANLFTYGSIGDAWTKQLRMRPVETMRASMPTLEAIAGDLTVKGQIAVRPIDLTTASGYRRPGVVLIGDAYATCCPIIGMGIMKVLTDADRLCTYHIPNWLKTNGMPAAKTSAYYDDPIKRACDDRAERMSRYSRSMIVDQSFIWAARRVRNSTARRGIYALKGIRDSVLGPPTAKDDDQIAQSRFK